MAQHEHNDFCIYTYPDCDEESVMYQREAPIKDKILAYLNGRIGCYARKTHGGPHSVGWPDIVGCYFGRCLMLEVKAPRGQATRLQAHELKKWEVAGAIVGIVRSVEDVEKLFGKGGAT